MVAFAKGFGCTMHSCMAHILHELLPAEPGLGCCNVKKLMLHFAGTNANLCRVFMTFLQAEGGSASLPCNALRQGLMVQANPRAAHKRTLISAIKQTTGSLCSGVARNGSPATETCLQGQ